MFTGIITDVGQITAREELPDGVRLTVQTSHAGLALGESVAVNGACLTVESFADGPRFFVSPETLKLTNLAALGPGAKVNLERALAVSAMPEARLSGHIVQGHVDGIGALTSLTPVSDDGGATELRVKLPAGLVRYVVPKGSIAIDGVSLTVNAIDGEEVSIMVIPHTLKHTGFHARRPGDAVNIEVDLIAKYVERLCTPYMK